MSDEKLDEIRARLRSDCFTNRSVEHDWRRVPFWLPASWADHYTHKCKRCGVYTMIEPSVLGARLWFAWFIALHLFAAFGFIEALRLVWGAVR